MHNELLLKKDKSRFSPYLEILPTSFPTLPYNYTPEEREICKKSFFFKKLLQNEKDMNETYKRLKQSKIKISFNEFYTLYLTAWSRFFDIYTHEGMKVTMVPFADMLNTSIGPKPCYYYFDENNNFIIKALRKIKKGEELFLRYAEGHNTQLLLGFGFTVKNNPKGYIDNFEVSLGKKLLEGEEKIQKIQKKEKIKIALNITPNLSGMKILKFRGFLEKNSPSKNEDNLNLANPTCKLIDLKIFTIISNHIKEALNNYQDSKINPLVFEKFDDINQKNIYRALYEEKRVLENNLFYISNFVEAMETNSFYKLETIIDLNYEYDFQYFNDCRLNWPKFLLKQ
jgi:hypothetical protein